MVQHVTGATYQLGVSAMTAGEWAGRTEKSKEVADYLETMLSTNFIKKQIVDAKVHSFGKHHNRLI